MAFNRATFQTRALTALVFVAVMMTGLLYSATSQFILISVIYVGCWKEFGRLAEKINGVSFHPYTWLGGGLLGYHLVILLGAQHLDLAGYNIRDNFSFPFLIAGILLFVWGIFKTPQVSVRAVAGLFGGILYLALPMGLLLCLSFPYGHFGQKLILYIIGSVWINDTMAYLAGSAIGKTPLSKISPKKTWEGTISGIVLSAALTWLLFSLIFLQRVEWSMATMGIAISLTAAISGTFGDLFESKLKRLAGVKDSGHIMPGHGGFLDRFDSVLWAAPAVWLLLKLTAQAVS